MFQFTANFTGIQAWGLGVQALPDGVHLCRIKGVAVENMKKETGQNAVLTLVSEQPETQGIEIKVWIGLPGTQHDAKKNAQFLSKWRQLLEGIGVDVDAAPNMDLRGEMFLNCPVHVLAAEPEPNTNGYTTYDFVTNGKAAEFFAGTWKPVYRRDKGREARGTNVSPAQLAAGAQPAFAPPAGAGGAVGGQIAGASGASAGPTIPQQMASAPSGAVPGPQGFQQNGVPAAGIPSGLTAFAGVAQR
jgi:hypothetical protein